MSATIQLPLVWANRIHLTATSGATALQPQLLASAVHHLRKQLPKPETVFAAETETVSQWAFYRRHTERLLRRYLYASMQVGRSPDLLRESVDRGWVSSRRVRTFEDALIFVLDVERCMQRLRPLDRQLITRRFIQDYTQREVAALLGLSLSGVIVKLHQALDRLTEHLVESDLLVLPGDSGPD